MGQSLNLYLGQPNGRKLDEMYRLCWTSGLKTTYYLRTLGATQVEKSTVDINKFGVQPRWMKSKSTSADISVDRGATTEAAEGLDGEIIERQEDAIKACSVDNPGCESCQ